MSDPRPSASLRLQPNEIHITLFPLIRDIVGRRGIDGEVDMSTHSATERDGGPADDTAPLPVVTIWGQYGAGAEEIGQVVAERLRLPFHGQAFSSAELEDGSGTTADSSDAGSLENRATLAQVFTAMGGAYGGFEGRDIVTTQKEKRDLVANNNDTVWRYAEEGGVIVGRNATVILAARPRTLHVLLTGDVKDRSEERRVGKECGCRWAPAG